MDADYIDIQRERRRQIFFGSIVALIIVFSVVYYFWGNWINRGTLLVYGNAPFTIEFFERGEVFECSTSPCEIKQKSGIQSFSATKDGYEMVIVNKQIKLWRTVEETINFKITPHIEKVDKYPEVEEKSTYKLTYDDKNKMQKLIRTNDVEENAIVYFQKRLGNPEIFGSGNIILIVDKDGKRTPAYKVNVKKQSKDAIPDSSGLENIGAGKWSNNGRYFVFSLVRQPGLWLMDAGGGIKQLDFDSTSQQVAWSNTDKLLVVTKLQTDQGEFIGYNFGYYDPVTDLYDPIDISDMPKERPENLLPMNDGKEIYFQTGDSTYKLVLG